MIFSEMVEGFMGMIFSYDETLVDKECAARSSFLIERMIPLCDNVFVENDTKTLKEL